MDPVTPRVVHRRQQPPQQPHSQPQRVVLPQRPVSLYDNLKQTTTSTNNGSSSHHNNGVFNYNNGVAYFDSITTHTDDDDGSLLLRAGAQQQQQPVLVRGSGASSSVGNLHAVVALPSGALSERARTPSQANCLSTTVPQNMAPEGWASRHAPTRSSLRHSRMIVLTRQPDHHQQQQQQQAGGVAHKYQPRVLRRRRLGMALSALLLLLGLLVTAVAVWLLLWAPRLPARDVPVYSGPPLLLAGLLGLILLGCCRKDYPGRPYSCCMYSFKAASVSLAALAALAALCASAFALLHVVSLWGSVCEPAHQVANATCTCELDLKDPSRSWAVWSGSSRHEYPDLSCPEVQSLLSVLLTGSGAANLLAGLLAGWYVLLHWRSRYKDVYARVRTAPPPVVISNSKA